MAFASQFAESVIRWLDRLSDRALRERLIRKAESLALNPRPNGVARLAGQEDVYRIRVGDYRILFSIMDKERTVLVVDIGDIPRVVEIVWPWVEHS